MNNKHLKHILIKHSYPAMLAQAKASTMPEDTLWQLLIALACRMAAARGLDDACLEPNGDAQSELPDIDLASVNVTLLGDVYTALMAGRRQRGSYYTPWSLAEIIAGYMLRSASPPTRILDPAMGSGHFLLAVARVITARLKKNTAPQGQSQARWAALNCLYGIDNDPLAVKLAAISLWLWANCPGTTPSMLSNRLLHGDALVDDVRQEEFVPPFDIVIGNPPYASAIARARTSISDPSALRSRYHTAKGSFDLSVPFVERAVTLCKTGGRCGLVLPNKLLSADYARPLRDWLAQDTTVEAIFDASRQNLFAASVYPVAVILTNIPPSPDHNLDIYRWTDRLTPPFAPGAMSVPGLPRRAAQIDLRIVPGQSWSSALDPDWDMLRHCWEKAVPLGDLATLAGGLAVGEAYTLRPAIFDAPEIDLPNDTFRLLTSGLIERHATAWGKRPARYLKTTYQRPAIAADVLTTRRRGQATAHKIVVAGLGKTPRAVVDHGQSQASVSTTIIIDSQWPLGALCAVLNSHLMGRICRAIFGGLALGGGHLRFGKPELMRIPLPDIDSHDRRLEHLDTLAGLRALSGIKHDIQTIEDQIEVLVRDLYGLGCVDIPL
ncbi:MAG: N-6 DNA methylase [Anaerolineae bacterium]|nr:N-6 DNA methylase [Anaerolineae bacterium]